MTVRVLVTVVVTLAAWLALRLADVAGDAVVRRWQRRRRGRGANGLVERGLAVVLGLGIATAAPVLAPPPLATAATGDEHDITPGPAGDASQPATMRPLTPAVAPPPPPSVEPTWTIEPGDHLWGLSHTALAEAFGRPPTDAEVAHYVAEVVDRNRHVLAVRDRPDLVFPGQVFVRPPLPGRWTAP